LLTSPSEENSADAVPMIADSTGPGDPTYDRGRTPVYPLGGQIPVPFEQKSSPRGDDARSGSNKKSALEKV
ncbi:hypothetical protein B0H12DRAFT_1107332, partial [Mycena haematopus]